MKTKKNILISPLLLIGLTFGNSLLGSNRLSKINKDGNNLIRSNVARMMPDTMNESDLTYSLTFDGIPKSIAKLPKKWKLKPKFITDEDKKQVIFNIDKSIDLYGGGEVVGDLRRNGTTITLWNTDNCWYIRDKGQRLYQSHPWIMGVRKDGTSFGIIFDTTYHAKLDLTQPGIINFTATTPEDYSVYVIEEKTPQDVVKTLASLTGTMDLPPMWSLGYQQCRWSYYPEKRVREIANTFRVKKIPCDVIWLDIDYMDKFKVFTVSKKYFPNMKKMVSDLHEQKFHVINMIDPGLAKNKNFDVYKDGTKKNIWIKDKDDNDYVGKVWPGKCVFPDFTMPKARIWWRDQLSSFMLQYGFDAVWNDMNEPAVFNGPDKSMPITNKHRGGGKLPAGPHTKYHNVYGMLMAKSSKAGLQKAYPNKRPFVLTRANFLGGQRYAATWTGDNSTSKAHRELATPMLITMGLSGQPFVGPDIPGFAGKMNSKSAAHWWAVGALYPFSRGHSTQKEHKEPWIYGEKTENVVRTAINRRYRLLPYFYTLMREASTNGLPVIRPVFFAEITNKKLRTEQESFLIGKNLLVIPVWDKNPPALKGFWQKINIMGKAEENDGYQPTLKQRYGSIIPVGKLQQSTMDNILEELTLSVVLNQNGYAEGTLYEDDGNGYEYKNGDYLSTKYVATLEHGKIIVKVDSTNGKRQRPSRKLHVNIHNNGKLYTANGTDGETLAIVIEQ
ncbi:TIM-barrel domain-containing protein [Lentisphaerota bacterium WC36G]|nr:DUF5110 domain-containing protein [Lentisphaerae bacterium WC36]